MERMLREAWSAVNTIPLVDPRIHPNEAGPTRFALAEKGFRPFFLLASAFAVAIVPVWLLVLAGYLVPTSTFAPMLWHAHEMLFGYTSAVIAGFLLTAASRWTGRETARGAGLLALAALWLAGRIAMVLPLPTLLVAMVDGAFLPALALVVGRVILGTRNRRNYGVLALIAVLAGANALTHLDALGLAPGWSRRALFAAMDVVVLMMLVVGGRVIPMFTRNVVRDSSIRNVRVLDIAAVALTLLGALAALLGSVPALAAGLALAASAAVFARGSTWGAVPSLREPMLWVLHFGHLWIAVGLLLRGIAYFVPLAGAAYTHAITVGGIGTLTLGMLARVSLGHTGRVIRARPPTTVAFLAISTAACLRVFAPAFPSSLYLEVLAVSAACWALAFGLFLATYTRILLSPNAEPVHA